MEDLIEQIKNRIINLEKENFKLDSISNLIYYGRLTCEKQTHTFLELLTWEYLV